MQRKHHVMVLVGLLCLAGFVQAVVIGRAVVPGRDAVRFAKAAQAVEAQGLLAALRWGREQPLFPIWVATVHQGAVQLTGPSPSLWAISVQWAAAIALVLTVIPLYFLLLRLFDPRIAMVGSILFCILPEVSRLGADGISDSTHLLFFTAALWMVVEYCRVGSADDSAQWASRPEKHLAAESSVPQSGKRCLTFKGSPLVAFGNTDDSPKKSHPSQSPLRRIIGATRLGMAPGRIWLVLAGGLTGLALLARAEAIVLAVALALGLVASALGRRSRLAVRTVVGGAAGYALGLALVLGTYLMLAGVSTPQAAVARVSGRTPAVAPGPLEKHAEEFLWQTAEGRPLHFAAKEGSIRHRGYVAALGQYGEELAEVFGYWVGVLALWGLWWHRGSLTRPAERFLQIFFVLFSLAAIYFVSKEGYLSARHLLPLLVAGIGVASVGTWEASVLLTRKLLEGATGVSPVPCGVATPRLASSHVLGAWTILALVVLGYLASASRPLRADRLAHRQAGMWLARKAQGNAAVLDTRGWTALYSAHPTYRYDEAKTALCDGRLGYVVVEPRELWHDSARAWTLRYLLKTAGECVARFGAPAGTSTDEGAVAVYRWHAQRFRLPSIRSKEENHSSATGLAAGEEATDKRPVPRRVGSGRFVQAISAREKKLCR